MMYVVVAICLTSQLVQLHCMYILFRDCSSYTSILAILAMYVVLLTRSTSCSSCGYYQLQMSSYIYTMYVVVAICTYYHVYTYLHAPWFTILPNTIILWHNPRIYSICLLPHVPAWLICWSYTVYYRAVIGNRQSTIDNIGKIFIS